MNTNILLAFSLAAVASVQAGTEDSYLDRLSPKAREFVEKYKAEKSAQKASGNIQKKKVVLKNDVESSRKVKLRIPQFTSSRMMLNRKWKSS